MRHFYTGNFEEKSAQMEFKDCVTAMLGGNATDDFKLKPIMILISKNPCVLRNTTHDTF